jgi:hypothetical protein
VATGNTDRQVDLDVSPVPPEPVRRAIEAAVRAPSPGKSEASAWWRAGAAESVRADLDRE